MRVGGALTRLGRWLLLTPHRDEAVPLPAPLEIGAHRFDVVQDLVDYTALSRELVGDLLRRRPENFRSEWHATPQVLRQDRWYYLSSRLYLFANAVHVHSTPELADDVTALAPDGGRVLDFGGGTGNLALALAAAGFRVDYLELSALQKDFVGFRVTKHRLEERVRVLDEWQPLAPRSYDLVCAFDVLEHLPDLRSTLEGVVLPSLAPGGLLAEQSPFVVNVSNPMHHEDSIGLDDLLHRHGLKLIAERPLYRLWQAARGRPASRRAENGE